MFSQLFLQKKDSSTRAVVIARRAFTENRSIVGA
jgi:hypothetical protein